MKRIWTFAILVVGLLFPLAAYAINGSVRPLSVDNLCIGPKDGKYQSGVPLVLVPCIPNKQRWGFVSAETSKVLKTLSTAGLYALKSDDSRGTLCMDVAGGLTSPGVKVQLWECNGSNAQVWRMDNLALKAGVKLVSMTGSGLCLDAAGGKFVAGAQLIIWGCHFGENQDWSIY